MTISVEIRTKIENSIQYVFTRSDFTGMASYSQIGRVLKAMVMAGELLNIGYGLYTKARINRITGSIMPVHPGGPDVVVAETIWPRPPRCNTRSNPKIQNVLWIVTRKCPKPI